MNTAIEVQRTPELIASEINHLKHQTRNVVLYNAIEIGRRLCEVKEFIPHGEWGKWLENSVDYSQSTANNLMRIFTEYGSDQMALFGETGPKSQAIGKLNYTQAIALLGVPAEDREQFIEENDVENMSTRELQQVIKERDEALKQAEEAKILQEEKELAEAEARRLMEIQTGLNTRLAELQKQLTAENKNKIVEQLQQSLEETDTELMEAHKRIEELEQQLKEKPINVQAAEVIEKIPEEVEQELAQLRKQNKSAAVVKYSLYFNNLVKGFQNLLGSLVDINETDPDEYEKYQHATLELISKMSARL